MRYINADALGIGKCNPDVFDDKGYAKGWNSAIEILQSAPTVDVVEVVRCKDCIHFESKDYVLFCKHPDGLDSIKPESFCSYGEKKDARYIDAEDFFDTFPEIDKIPYSSWAVTHIADVRPIIRGKWIESTIPNEQYVCSVCGGACWYYDFMGSVAKSKFCPNCGADLRQIGGDKE